MNKNPHRWKSWSLSLLAILLTCFYPCVFLFSQNAGEAAAADMLPFFLIFLITAFGSLLFFSIFLRNISRAATLACLSMLVIINFSMITDSIKGWLPWFQDKFFLLFAGLVLLGLLILCIRKKPDLTAACGVIALTFGILTAISLLQAIPKLIQVAAYHSEDLSAQAPDVEFQNDKPNVYYLIFDEYGGDENLEAYFGFDNSAFYAQLEDRGFSLSHTSRNTESCWSDTLIPNLLNLDYVADDSMPEKVRRAFLREPLLTRLFGGNGYRVNLINHRAYLSISGARELTQGQTEDTISDYLFDNSIYCKLPWIKDKLSRWMFENYRDNYQGPLENALDALKNCYQAAQGQPTLTISYIQCPHAPFLYNADGSVRDLFNAWLWKDASLYPGQLQYLNTVILEAIDNIQSNDPDAVILLQSDHGARVPLHMVEQYGGPRFDAEAETPIMQSVLCCAYIPGEIIDIEGDTCINAARKTIDAALGTQLGTISPASGYVVDEMYNAEPHPEAPADTPAETPSEAPTVVPEAELEPELPALPSEETPALPVPPQPDTLPDGPDAPPPPADPPPKPVRPPEKA